MNNVVFSTGGDWDSTTLHNNNEEVLAERLFVEMHTGRDGDGEPARGGISNGGNMTAVVYPQGGGDEIGIFPGRLELNFPKYKLIVENNNPAFAFEFTTVWFDGRDVTDSVLDLFVDVDAGNNNVKAYITLYKPHFFGADEVATYNII